MHIICHVFVHIVFFLYIPNATHMSCSVYPIPDLSGARCHDSNGLAMCLWERVWVVAGGCLYIIPGSTRSCDAKNGSEVGHGVGLIIPTGAVETANSGDETSCIYYYTVYDIYVSVYEQMSHRLKTPAILNICIGRTLVYGNWWKLLKTHGKRWTFPN